MVAYIEIDESLDRLCSHFGSRILLRPPASATDLANLEHLVGAIPRSYLLFLSSCNGLRLELTGHPAEARILGIHDVYAALDEVRNPATVNGLIPLCGDPSGLCDSLCVAPSTIGGLILRWNPWMGSPEVVGSSFDRYFCAWSHHKVGSFDHQGRAVAGARSPFDVAWIAKYDPCLLKLRKESVVLEALHTIVLVSPSGDDME